MYQQKTTGNAIAAMSRLAELYAEPAQVASSREIAESRNLPIPLVAKILTDLSRGGLVTGSPGPGGGYRLARAPSEIRLKDVVALFEREPTPACPFGPGWCGNQAPCPLHHSLLAMQQIFEDYLRNTTFAVFAQAAASDRTPAAPAAGAQPPAVTLDTDRKPKAGTQPKRGRAVRRSGAAS